MIFKAVHNNFNVYDLNKSIEFYEKALGFVEKRRKVEKNQKYIIVFMGNEHNTHQIELTWLKDWDRPYNLGDNEIHLAFVTDEFEKAYALHRDMGCICFENKEMGIYFISDPDGYWIEIIPAR